jgi:PRTRC genetic system protein E
MSFFSQLADIIGDNYSVQITVQKKNQKLSVSVLPQSLKKGDEASKQKLTPIVATGTPHDIDIGLIPAIAAPLGEFNELVVSGESFVNSTDRKPTAKKEEPAKKPDIQTELKMDAPPEKKEETVKAETPTTTEEAKPEPEKKEEVSETFDEDTGEVLAAAATMDDDEDEDEQVEEKPKDPEPAGDQSEMFDDEDW